MQQEVATQQEEKEEEKLKFIKINIVAKMYGVSIKTVRRWCYAGLLTAYRLPLSSRIILSVKEIEEMDKKIRKVIELSSSGSGIDPLALHYWKTKAGEKSPLDED